MEPSAFLVGEDAVAPGFPNCGVLVTPNISARNCKLNRSVILKFRNTLAFRLNTPGPRRILRPLVPNRTAVTGANAFGLK